MDINENDPLNMLNKDKSFCYSKNKKELDFTCLKKDTILQLVNIYNTTFCDNNQDFCLENKIIIVKNRSIKEIYRELKNKLSKYNKLYSVEQYWQKINEFSKIFIHNNYFHITKMPNEWCSTISEWRNDTIDAPWLSNYDIDDVIIKYEHKYNKFKFLGSAPIDFRRKRHGTCTLDLFSNSDKSWLSFDNNRKVKYCNFDPSIYKDKTHFGIVFNTDNFDGPGKHWMSLYFCIDEKNPCILFFDSAVTYTEGHSEVNGFIKNIEKMYPKLKFVIKKNKTKHQTSNSECGMYSIYFLLTMLDAELSENKKHTALKFFDKYFDSNTTIPDKIMILYRTKLFDASVCKKIHLSNIN